MVKGWVVELTDLVLSTSDINKKSIDKIQQIFMKSSIEYQHNFLNHHEQHRNNVQERNNSDDHRDNSKHVNDVKANFKSNDNHIDKLKGDAFSRPFIEAVLKDKNLIVSSDKLPQEHNSLINARQTLLPSASIS